MTKENLITVPVGTTLEEAELILHKHRVEKLLVVNDQYELKGLITVKDIQKKLKYPNGEQGRSRAGCAWAERLARPATFWSGQRSWCGRAPMCWRSTRRMGTPRACWKR